MDVTSDLVGPDGPVVYLAGEVDLAGAEEVRTVGESAVAATPNGGHVIIDLSRVTFLDSSGLSALVQLRVVAIEHSVRLVLRGATGAPLRVLRITGLYDVFESDQ